MNSTYVFAIGFLGQGIFGIRLLVQWIQSEKEGKVVSPVLFWYLSLIASTILIFYGVLRSDPVILLGQFLAYYIYIRNLQLKEVWKRIPTLARYITLSFPLLIVAWLYFSPGTALQDIIFNESITSFMLTLGTVGQILFTFRFIYQWQYSERKKESLLPVGFWIISASGSILIIIYGIYRLDPVIIIGQVLGSIVYWRNILIYFSGGMDVKSHKENG